MGLMLIGTTHAEPITNFNVIENISDDIIGGNINRLVVEYDSQESDAAFTFKFISPYILWKDTPEIKYVNIVVDNSILTCTNKTTYNNYRFELECDYHLHTGHHNTTVMFQLAPNIMPGDYDFEFYMQVDNVVVPVMPVTKVTSSGGGSRSYTPTITKICTVEVIVPFKNTTIEPIIEEPEYEHKEDHGEDTPENITFVNETQNETSEINDGEQIYEYKWLKITIALIVLIMFYWILFGDDIKCRIKKLKTKG